MKCPICNDPVDDHTFDEDAISPDSDLMVTEHWDSHQETYDSVIHIYKCHSDHTFYMNPSEITFKTTI
jgi:hypothetical protein